MRFWKTSLVVGACAGACAAPMMLAQLVAGVTIAGAGAAFTGELGIAALILACGGVVYLWQRRKAAKAQCACPADGGCNTRQSCVVGTGNSA